MAARHSRKLKSFAAIILIVGVVWVLRQWTSDPEIIRVDGQIVTVIDGDSFKAGDDEFRIYGIDAPEYRQTCSDRNGAQWPCGKEARSILERNLRKRQFSCAVRTRDRFGRLVVNCTDAGNIDLGAEIVKLGYAVSGSHFDEVTYGIEEAAAQKAGRGIWRGSFIRPDQWRAKNPRR